MTTSLADVDFSNDDEDLPKVSDLEPSSYCLGFKKFGLNSKKIRPRQDMPNDLIPFDAMDRLHYVADEGHEVIHVDWPANARVDANIADFNSQDLARRVLEELEACVDEHNSSLDDSPVFSRYKTWTLDLAVALAASAANRRFVDLDVNLEPEEPRKTRSFLGKLVESASKAVCELVKDADVLLKITNGLA